MNTDYPCEICYAEKSCYRQHDNPKGMLCRFFKLRCEYEEEEYEKLMDEREDNWILEHFGFGDDNEIDDQSAKADDGKLKLTLVPHQIIRDIARVRMYGNAKYPDGGPDNWKRVDPQRYRDALCRHLLAYLEDPHGVDEESGLPHIAHVACNVAFLCEMESEDNE